MQQSFLFNNRFKFLKNIKKPNPNFLIEITNKIEEIFLIPNETGSIDPQISKCTTSSNFQAFFFNCFDEKANDVTSYNAFFFIYISLEWLMIGRPIYFFIYNIFNP